MEPMSEFNARVDRALFEVRRAHRQTRRMVAAAVAAGLAGLLLGGGALPGRTQAAVLTEAAVHTVQAPFTVVDAKQKPILTVGTSFPVTFDGHSLSRGLLVSDAGGQPIGAIGSVDLSPGSGQGLILWAPGGSPSMSLGQDNTSTGGGISIRNNAGVTVARLGTDDAAAGQMEISDASGNRVGEMFSGASSGQLNLSTPGGTSVFHAP